MQGHTLYRPLKSTEFSRLAAVRYLAGILKLPTFWHWKIYNDPRPYDKFLCRVSHQSNTASLCLDPHSHEDVEARCVGLHSFVNEMCKICIFLLQDLSLDGKEQAYYNDLVLLDVDGIRDFLHAFLFHLPLVFPFLQDDGNSTVECQQSVILFGDLLQRQVSFTVPHYQELIRPRPPSERSKVVFPDASSSARDLLKKMKVAISTLSSSVQGQNVPETVVGGGYRFLACFNRSLIKKIPNSKNESATIIYTAVRDLCRQPTR